MDTVHILKEARALIADEKNWIQGYYSSDEEGVYVRPHEPEATCFCSVGAMHKVMDLPLHESIPEPVGILFAADEKLRDNFDGSFEGVIVNFNDENSHAEVLALFDRAIARAESGAA
ncbi:hypothetical protein J5288_08650 [Agrobacterium sp. S2/73]|uniref:DUF6197 family protein n=1 Tax=unclassified Agrobacterium TaxID=2632611 RepID=UPI001ADA63DF|nr:MULTISPECIES: hypothetical protein [unclassified Agrobacterium]MBO9108771.1 hypothetical protein [Agrobacterium sp. S2/73]QXZ73472.1 hypothetical protein J5276_05860 [Agrobacterium sp. S7/73]